MSSFRDLIAYKKSFALAMDIFWLTKTFPKEETYSLIDQIRRSSRSVFACIAEAYKKRKYPNHFVSKLTDSFFKIMINKSRSEILYATSKEFINQYNVIKHIIRAYVTSATPLSEENKKKIVAELEAATQGSIELHTKVDPKLIGGFVLTVGDMQVDTSISTSLNKLKQDFTRGVSR